MSLLSPTKFDDKRVSEKKLLGIDWDNRLKGTTISDSNWEAGDLTVTDKTTDGTKTKAFISGGEAGKSYTVTIQVTTSVGEILEEVVPLKVV